MHGVERGCRVRTVSGQLEHPEQELGYGAELSVVGMEEWLESEAGGGEQKPPCPEPGKPVGGVWTACEEQSVLPLMRLVPMCTGSLSTGLCADPLQTAEHRKGF